MHDLTVYTAGVLNPAKPDLNYRATLPDIPGIAWRHPKLFTTALYKENTQEFRNLIIGAMKCADEFWIKKCDLFLVVFEDWDTEKELQTGTSTECGIARALGKTSIAVASNLATRNRRHFPLAFCDTVVDNIDEACEILQFLASWQTHPDNLKYAL